MVWLYKPDSVRKKCIPSITTSIHIFLNDNDLQSH